MNVASLRISVLLPGHTLFDPGVVRSPGAITPSAFVDTIDLLAQSVAVYSVDRHATVTVDQIKNTDGVLQEILLVMEEPFEAPRFTIHPNFVERDITFMDYLVHTSYATLKDINTLRRIYETANRYVQDVLRTYRSCTKTEKDPAMLYAFDLTLLASFNRRHTPGEQPRFEFGGLVKYAPLEE